MRILPLLLALALLGGGSQRGWASERVEAALLLGQNVPPSTFAHRAPEQLAVRLRQVFGFQHYVMLKQDKIELKHTWRQWFLPRKDFFISLRPLPIEPGEPQLVDYEIYQEGFIVARGKYEPSEGTPLFINGPDFKNGRLIFVLEAR
jgi:hypothetical protein